jgi:hypothetical protein
LEKEVELASILFNRYVYPVTIIPKLFIFERVFATELDKSYTNGDIDSNVLFLPLVNADV